MRLISYKIEAGGVADLGRQADPVCAIKWLTLNRDVAERAVVP